MHSHHIDVGSDRGVGYYYTTSTSSILRASSRVHPLAIQVRGAYHDIRCSHYTSESLRCVHLVADVHVQQSVH
jgi:hypothetical protein